MQEDQEVEDDEKDIPTKEQDPLCLVVPVSLEEKREWCKR